MAIPFDTLDYARKLEVAGVPTAQAELQATALGEALAKAVATPADLAALEGRLTTRIDAIDARLGARIDAIDAKLGSRIDAIDARFDALEDAFGVKLTALGNELRLELGGRIDRLAATVDTMKWMFGFVAALNIGMLARLLMI